MKKSFVFCFLLFAVITSKAQHTVSGIVSDKADDARLLDNVAVFIPEFNRFDISKEGGTYILRNVGVGIVTIQFIRTGYKPLVIALDTKDSATVLNVKMEKAVNDLQQVSITSERIRATMPLPWTSASYAPTGFQQSGSIHAMGVLASQPGVDRITQGNGIQRPVIRGMSGSEIVSYQFGVRVDNQSWDEYQDLELNDAGNASVEVIKGPATLLYGPNASGGALIWKDRLPTIAGHVDGKVDLGFHTNTRGYEAGAHINGAGKKGIFYGMDIMRRMHGSYIQGDTDAVDKNQIDKDFAANSKFNNTSARAMVGWSKKWGAGKFTFAHLGQRLGIIALVDRSKLDDGVFTEEQRKYAMEAPYVDVKSNLLSFQQTVMLNTGSLQFNLSGQSSARKELEQDSLSTFERVAMELKSYTADFRYVTDPSLKRGWTFGFQTMSQSNSNSGEDTVVADATTTDFGLYALNRYSLSSIDLLFGARIDQRSIKFGQDKQFRSPSFSAGMIYKASTSFNLKMNATTGFSAPDIYQLTASGRREGQFRYEQGNADLRASRNLQADLGLEWERPSFRLTANVYTNRISDKSYLSPTGNISSDSLPVYEFLQSDATINGFEAGLLIHPKEVQWVQLGATYGFVRGELNDGLGYLPAQPADKLTASLTFSKEKMQDLYHPYLRLVVSGFSKRDDVAAFEPQTEGYTLFDAHVGGYIKAGQRFIEFSLSGMNLLNTSYYNHLSLIPRELQIREMGRNICIRIGIPIGIVNPDRPVREETKSGSGS